MFNDLKTLVDNNMELNLKSFDDVKVTTDGLDGRVKALEDQIEMLKKMSQPTVTVAGDDGAAAGLLDMLADMKKELEQKIADLEKRVTDCESTNETQ